MKGLFLDDERDPTTPNRGIYYFDNIEWTVVRTSTEFIHKIEGHIQSYLQTGIPVYEIVSLDHYLGKDDPRNGEQCFLEMLFEYISEGITELPKIVFHSADRSKRVDMYEVLESYKKDFNLT